MLKWLHYLLGCDMALIEIGEIGISSAKRDYLLRPSFRAMQSLGSPTEIVKIFADIHEGVKVNPYFIDTSVREGERKLMALAGEIIAACVIEGDPYELLGYSSGPKRYKFGDLPGEHWIPVARALMRHGVIGVLPKKTYAKKADDTYVNEFKAADFVASAVAALGVSDADAWNMTMTSYAAAMRAKYGEPEKKEPSTEEHDEGMAWLEEINRLRSIK